MSDEPFNERLKKWRGKRKQHEAAFLLSAPIRTYQQWEQNRSTPSKYAIAEIERIMKENPE